MTTDRKFFLLLFLILIILGSIFILIFNYSQKKKDENLALQPISINLLTSVHPNLDWNFKPVKSKIVVFPGDVTTVEYIVENLGNQETTGIATFVYFPNDLGNYISKIKCFCYDAQSLKPNQKQNYSLVLLIDPEVTKDSKTKDLKEATIQFTFFDYKEYKEQKS